MIKSPIPIYLSTSYVTQNLEALSFFNSAVLGPGIVAIFGATFLGSPSFIGMLAVILDRSSILLFKAAAYK